MKGCVKPEVSGPKYLVGSGAKWPNMVNRSVDVRRMANPCDPEIRLPWNNWARGEMAKIDLEHLARQTMSDADLQRDILLIFRDQVASKLDGLDVASPDLKAQAHSIKGSAKGIGAFEVAEFAELLEKGEGDMAEQIARLKNAVHAALDEIDHILLT